MYSLHIAGSQESMCKLSQFSCSVFGPCISLADVCNNVGDCPNGEDEASCGK